MSTVHFNTDTNSNTVLPPTKRQKTEEIKTNAIAKGLFNAFTIRNPDGTLFKFTDNALLEESAAAAEGFSDHIFQKMLDRIKRKVGQEAYEEVKRNLIASSPSQLFEDLLEWARDLHQLLRDARLSKAKLQPPIETIVSAFGSRQQLLSDPMVMITEITRLELSASLKTLPWEIALFKNLKELEISPASSISDLRPVAKLPKLKRFQFLRNEPLDALPEEFKNLTTLRDLTVSCTKLPSGLFSHLTQLKDLFLTNCPRPPFAEIVRLPLRTLGLVDCSLSTFPTEVLAMDLQELCLSRNPIATIPSEIQKLSHLEELSLDGTQITTLPKELANIEGLSLDIKDTPIETIPEEILFKDPIGRNTNCWRSLLSLPEKVFEINYLSLLVCYLLGHFILACEEKDGATVETIGRGLPRSVIDKINQKLRLSLTVENATLEELKRATLQFLFDFILDRSSHMDGFLKKEEFLENCLQMLKKISSDTLCKEACERALSLYPDILHQNSQIRQQSAAFAFTSKAREVLFFLSTNFE